MKAVAVLFIVSFLCIACADPAPAWGTWDVIGTPPAFSYSAYSIIYNMSLDLQCQMLITIDKTLVLPLRIRAHDLVLWVPARNASEQDFNVTMQLPYYAPIGVPTQVFVAMFTVDNNTVVATLEIDLNASFPIIPMRLQPGYNGTLTSIVENLPQLNLYASFGDDSGNYSFPTTINHFLSDTFMFTSVFIGDTLIVVPYMTYLNLRVYAATIANATEGVYFLTPNTSGT